MAAGKDSKLGGQGEGEPPARAPEQQAEAVDSEEEWEEYDPALEAADAGDGDEEDDAVPEPEDIPADGAADGGDEAPKRGGGFWRYLGAAVLVALLAVGVSTWMSIEGPRIDVAKVFADMSSADVDKQVAGITTLFNNLDHRGTRNAFLKAHGLREIVNLLDSDSTDSAVAAAVALTKLVDRAPDLRREAVRQHRAIMPALRLANYDEREAQLSGIYLLSRLAAHGIEIRELVAETDNMLGKLVEMIVEGAANGDDDLLVHPLHLMRVLSDAPTVKRQLLGTKLIYTLLQVVQASEAQLSIAASLSALKHFVDADQALAADLLDSGIVQMLMKIVRTGQPTSIHAALDLVDALITTEAGSISVIEATGVNLILDLVMNSKHPFALKERAVDTIVALGDSVHVPNTTVSDIDDHKKIPTKPKEEPIQVNSKGRQRVVKKENKYLSWLQVKTKEQEEESMEIPKNEQESPENKIAGALVRMLKSDFAASRSLSAEAMRDCAMTGGSQMRRTFAVIGAAPLLWQMMEPSVAIHERRAGMMAFAALAMERPTQLYFQEALERNTAVLLHVLMQKGDGVTMHMRQSAASVLSHLCAEKAIRKEVIRLNGVPILMDLYKDAATGIEVATAASVLKELARDGAGRNEIIKLDGFRISAEFARGAKGVVQENAIGVLGCLALDKAVSVEIRSQGLIPVILELLASRNVVTRSTASEALSIIGRNVDNLRVMTKLGLKARLGPQKPTESAGVRDLRAFLDRAEK